MTQTQKLQNKLTVGQLIAVTNKVNHQSQSGTYEGFENGRLVLRTSRGTIHSYDADNTLWLFRTSYKNLV